MFKRSQKQVSEESQHWYQDQYQHVLTQRNLLALIALGALLIALFAVLTIMRLAPLKSVEPYLLQVDEKSGITQRVNPITRQEYIANEAIDRYWAATYITSRESYNTSIVLYNHNLVRLMSVPQVFQEYRRQVDASLPGSLAARLGSYGRRDVKIRSLAYITNPTEMVKKRKKDKNEREYKIIQARITTVDVRPNSPDVEENWVVTISFEYAKLAINESEQLINPLGFQVAAYQIQREIN